MASDNPNGKNDDLTNDDAWASSHNPAVDSHRQTDAAQSAAALAGGASRKQEALIAALLTEPTYAQAARKAGVGERTLYRWLAQPGFQTTYRRARQQLVAAAVARVQSMAAEAVETLASIIRTGKKDSDRLRAAIALLDHTMRDALRDADRAAPDADEPTLMQRLLATAEGRDLAIKMTNLLAKRPSGEG
jgi:transposase-like protein